MNADLVCGGGGREEKKTKKRQMHCKSNLICTTHMQYRSYYGSMCK